MISFFTTSLRAEMSVLTIVVFWATTGLYFIAVGCAQLPCTRIACLNRALVKLKHLLEETLPFSPIEDTLHMSPDEYEHPALETYLGPGRTLEQALRGERSVDKMDDEEGPDEMQRLYGHPSPSGEVDQWEPVRDEEDDWSPTGRHMMQATSTAMNRVGGSANQSPHEGDVNVDVQVKL